MYLLPRSQNTRLKPFHYLKPIYKLGFIYRMRFSSYRDWMRFAFRYVTPMPIMSMNF